MFANDLYNRYAKELAKDRYNPLSIDAEKLLLCQQANGCEEAFVSLVSAHLRFVIYVLKSFKLPDNVDIMDLIQAGNYGLTVGIRKFDMQRFSCRVATYCAYWIRFHIRECLDKFSDADNSFTEFSEDRDYDIITHDTTLLEEISKDIIDYTFKPLTGKEKLILTYYFGLDATQKSRTLKEIGSILNFSIEGIRLLRNTAISKINKEKLMEFLN